MDAWLEITACPNSNPCIILDGARVKGIPALSNVFSAAEHAKTNRNNSQIWDYSLRLHPDEIDKIKGVVSFGRRLEDARSVILAAEVIYGDTCYMLRLFIEKSQ